MEIVREELIGLLVAGPVSVTFTKADGRSFNITKVKEYSVV
jgi:hypothetical protein